MMIGTPSAEPPNRMRSPREARTPSTRALRIGIWIARGVVVSAGLLVGFVLAYIVGFVTGLIDIC